MKIVIQNQKCEQNQKRKKKSSRKTNKKLWGKKRMVRALEKIKKPNTVNNVKKQTVDIKF